MEAAKLWSIANTYKVCKIRKQKNVTKYLLLFSKFASMKTQKGTDKAREYNNQTEYLAGIIR